MNKKRTLIIIAAIAALILAVSFTVAYMFKRSNEIDNTFEKAVVQCAVEEVYDASTGIKSSVKVRNTGNIDEYLRVRLISYWVDDDGNVVGKASQMPTVSYDSENWLKGSADTYYYNVPVAPGALVVHDLLTSPVTLTTSSMTLGADTVTVYQVLEIIPEAVQARPTAAAADVWEVTITDSTITAVN